MNYRLLTVKGVPCLTGHYGNHPTFCFLPDVAEDEMLRAVLEELRRAIGSPLLLRPLDAEKLERVMRLYPDAEIIEARSMHDYIYLQSDLSTLIGNRFHQKRNHINNFEKKYNWEYVSVTPDQLPLLRETAAHLFAVDGRLPDEYEAILEILDHFEELKVKAGVLLVEGTPVAYSIGEVMCDDTALIHIEKADRSYDGAYSMINKLFAGEFADCTYINREEDMGIPGLRKAKTSYHPVRMGEYSIAKV
ncbi:MAG: DUF2156 domain-containing protein [Clostridia bacterium]|nr:DUF2156 domain-containing protein [Clostridia bacterium]